MKKALFPISIAEEIALRPFHIDDAESLAYHANNPNISKSLNDGFPNPYTYNDAREFIARRKDENIPQILAITYSNKVIGAIGIFLQPNVQRKNAEIGYWLSEEFWGQGICSKSISAMIRYAFNNFDLVRLYARPFPFNIASQRALEKNGFYREAIIKDGLFKDGKLYDEWIYSLRKSDLDEKFFG